MMQRSKLVADDCPSVDSKKCITELSVRRQVFHVATSFSFFPPDLAGRKIQNRNRLLDLAGRKIQNRNRLLDLAGRN